VERGGDPAAGRRRSVRLRVASEAGGLA